MNRTPDVIDILLVDDDLNLYEYYLILFDNAFWPNIVRIHFCDSGEKLEESFANHQIDIVLLDQRLGDGERGLDCIPKIRQLSDDVLIIMNSTYGSEELAAEAIRMGVDDYIEGGKEDYRELIKVLERAIEKTAEEMTARREISLCMSDVDKEIKSIERECSFKLERIKGKLEK